PFTMKSRVTPYSFWAVTSLRTAPLRFHSPYSAISDLSPSSPISISAAPPGKLKAHRASWAIISATGFLVIFGRLRTVWRDRAGLSRLGVLGSSEDPAFLYLSAVAVRAEKRLPQFPCRSHLKCSTSRRAVPPRQRQAPGQVAGVAKAPAGAERLGAGGT